MMTLIQITADATKKNASAMGLCSAPKYTLSCPDFVPGDIVQVRFPDFPEEPARIATVTAPDEVTHYHEIVLSSDLWPNAAPAKLTTHLKLHESAADSSVGEQMLIEFEWGEGEEDEL